MGLDMYLEGHKALMDSKRTEDGFNVGGIELELGYWRKHPNLHGYIVNTYADGVDNCQDIELNAEALTDIIMAIQNEQLPHTEGFFFGSSDNTEEERKADIAIFSKALAWLEGIPADPPPKPIVDDGIVKIFEVEMRPLIKEWRSVVYRASW